MKLPNLWPVSLCKSVFFSLMSILFIQYSRKNLNELPCSWNLTHTGYDVQYFIPNSLIASFLRSLWIMFDFWKAGDYWWKYAEKNTDLKRLTGRLKLCFLTEIGRFHWNQGEEVAHFAWFGEPCIHHWCGSFSLNSSQMWPIQGLMFNILFQTR
jgi:hypothetical protein